MFALTQRELAASVASRRGCGDSLGDEHSCLRPSQRRRCHRGERDDQRVGDRLRPRRHRRAVAPRRRARLLPRGEVARRLELASVQPSAIGGARRCRRSTSAAPELVRPASASSTVCAQRAGGRYCRRPERRRPSCARHLTGTVADGGEPGLRRQELGAAAHRGRFYVKSSLCDERTRDAGPGAPGARPARSAGAALVVRAISSACSRATTCCGRCATRWGVAGGVRNLQWLFTATFLAMLAAVPVYGALVARLPRRRFIPLVYHFFVANLAIFWLLLTLGIERANRGARVLRLDQRVQPVRGVGVLVVHGRPVHARAGQAPVRLHRRGRHRGRAGRAGADHRPGASRSARRTC